MSSWAIMTCCTFLLTGLLCVVVSMSFFQLAIMYAKASTVAIIFSANPVFTIPIAGFLLKEKATTAMRASLCVSLAGIICILNPFSVSIDFTGILLVVLSAVTFSLYSVIGKMRSEKYGSVANTCFTFLAGDLILFLLMLVSNLPVFERLNLGKGLQILVGIPFVAGINQGNILIVIYLGIVVSGFGYLAYFMAMEKSSAGKASIAFFIKPALAPILALIILGEVIPLNTLAGIALIIAASYGTLTGKNPNLDNKGET